MVRTNVEHCRIFPFAFGPSPNSHFLQILSKVAGGYYEVFDRSRKSKWEVKIFKLITKLNQNK